MCSWYMSEKNMEKSDIWDRAPPFPLLRKVHERDSLVFTINFHSELFYIFTAPFVHVSQKLIVSWNLDDRFGREERNQPRSQGF